MEVKTADIKHLIIDQDDFGHEMRVGHVLADLAWERQRDTLNSTQIESPDHGGTYADSITGKLRQFDYRCRIMLAQMPEMPRWSWCAMLAIECKNLHKSSPLVICGRERTGAESYYAIIESFTDDFGYQSVSTKGVLGQQFYEQGKFVGKSLVRLKVKGNTKLEAVSDPDIYGKWSQALSSSVELAESACKFAKQGCKRFATMILPIVVVPNHVLWAVQYDGTGSIHKDPEQVDECEYFVEKRFPIARDYPFVLTHVHFVTLKGLRDLLARFWKHRRFWEWALPGGRAK